MERWKKLRGPVLVVLACALPYLAYKYGGQVVGPAAADRQKDPVDPEVPGLYAVMATDGSYVEYQDGTRVRMEAFGLAALTWADHRKAPDRFRDLGVAPAEADFPLVLFFNASGFDASGGVQVIRRARDGSEVYRAPDKPKLVKAAVARRDGTFKVFFWDWTEAVVDAKEWYARYLGVEPVPALPPPEELDKLTPEQLKALGVERLTRDEYEKRFGRPPAKDKDGPKVTDTAAQGVRGQVVQLPHLAPLATEVRAYAGRVDPKKLGGAAVAAEGRSGPDGRFALGLPDGTYTIAVKVGQAWRGNAVSDTTWPVVEVKGGWVDNYDFRVVPK